MLSIGSDNDGVPTDEVNVGFVSSIKEVLEYEVISRNVDVSVSEELVFVSEMTFVDNSSDDKSLVNI
jgi:hypothetical protein